MGFAISKADSSLFFGHLPLIIKMYTSRKAEAGNKKPEKSKSKEDDNGLIISFLNCYAAGIFFATCILHMLPEISEKMKNEILKGSWKRVENWSIELFTRNKKWQMDAPI